MKKLVFSTIFMLAGVFAGSAQISMVEIDLQGNFGLEIKVGSHSYVYVDPYGNIADHNLQGNVRYYDGFYDELAGRIKSIGRVEFEYYDRFGRDETVGKIKSIGSVKFTYYDVFDRDEHRGKIKSVGGQKITYYDVFGPNELIGKVKSIAGVEIGYYDRFGDRYAQGRLKNVGKSRYTYYDQFSGQGRAGELKSGPSRVRVEGIEFNIIRNDRRPGRGLRPGAIPLGSGSHRRSRR